MVLSHLLNTQGKQLCIFFCKYNISSIGSIIAHKLYLSNAALISNEADYWCSSIKNNHWKRHRANQDSLRFLGMGPFPTIFFSLTYFQPNAFGCLTTYGTDKLSVDHSWQLYRGVKGTCKFTHKKRKKKKTLLDHYSSDWTMICSTVAKRRFT